MTANPGPQTIATPPSTHSTTTTQQSNSPSDWSGRRDATTPTRLSSERFDPDNSGRTGGGQLAGKITQIRYDVRRFEVAPGQWVREFTVPIDLVSHTGSVDPQTRQQLGDQVNQSLDNHYNQRYQLPGGDQLHIKVDFSTPAKVDPNWDSTPQRNVPVEVFDSTVDKGKPSTNQTQWDVHDHPDGLTHEVMHFLGLGEGYADPKMLFNRQDQPGIMGPDVWNGATFLTDHNLGKIHEVASTAGPLHEHAFADPTPPPAGHHADTSAPQDHQQHQPSPADPHAIQSPANAPTKTDQPAIVPGGNKDFQQSLKDYRITPVVDSGVLGGPVGPRTPGHENAIGYVATVMTTPDVDLHALAKKYADGFHDADSSKGRFGLVIGVNGTGNGKSGEIQAAVDKFTAKWNSEGTFPVAVVGFTWTHPKVDQGKAEVDQKTIPYGAIRETITRHPHTEAFAQQIRDGNPDAHVYLHTGDSDVHSLNTAKGPLFDAVSEKYSGNTENPPEIISGGYHVPAKDGPVAVGAAKLDLDVRQAMANVDPRSVYFPEPNTFVRLDPETGNKVESNVTFGVKNGNTNKFDYGPKEGQGLTDSVQNQRKHNWDYQQSPQDIAAFDSGFAVTTDGGRIAQKLGSDPTKLMELAQSHANKTGWTDQVTHYLTTVHPHLSADTAQSLSNIAFKDISSASPVPSKETVKTLAGGLSTHDKGVLKAAQQKDPAAVKKLLQLSVDTRNALIDGLNQANTNTTGGASLHTPANAPAKPSEHTADSTTTEPSSATQQQPTVLEGKSLFNKPTTFALSEVNSAGMADKNGHQVGGAFPSKKGDERVAEWWGSQTTDRPVVKYSQLHGPGTKSTSQPAPWHTDHPDRKPVFVYLHSGPEQFKIKVGEGRTVRVDGTTLAKMVLQGPEFQTALNDRPDAPIVLLACESGQNPAEGGAAHDFAKAIQDAGHARDVYAPTQTINLVPAFAAINVDAGGTFVKFAAPVSLHTPANAPQKRAPNHASGSGTQAALPPRRPLAPVEEESETTLIPQAVRDGLPDYLRTSQGLGPSTQLRPVGGADIRPGLLDLAPALRGNPTLDLVQTQVDTNVGSFLGDGRSFPVRVGGQDLELKARAEFDWNGLSVDTAHPDTDPAKASTADSGKTEHSAKDNRDTNLNLTGSFTAAPPLVVSASVQVPTGANISHETKSAVETGSASTVEAGELRQVKVPVTIKFSLHDRNGNPVDHTATPDAPSTGRSVRGDVDLSVPTTFKQPGDFAVQDLTHAPPSKFGVEEAVSNTAAGNDFFHQVATGLPAHVSEVGSPGRTVLQNFLGDANIKSKLPAMSVFDGDAHPDKGWVRSEPLFKGPKSSSWSSKGNAVEMRAVARRVQVIETVDNVKNTDTDSVKTTQSEKNSAKRNAGGTLMAGGGADAGAVFFAVGPTVGVSHESEKTQEHTQTNVTKNSAETTGKAVRYRVVYDLQVRSVGHAARTLDGHVDAHLWATQQRADQASLGAGTPGPQGRQGADRTHFAPEHIESGKSLGGAIVDDFSGGDRLYRSVVDVLRDVPGRKWYHLSSDKFIRQFDDPEFANGLSSSVNDVLSRDDNTRTALSDQQLSHLVDRMLSSDGLTIPLVKNGTFRDYHTIITLRAQLNDVGDLDLIDVDKSSGGSKTTEKNGSEFTNGSSTTVSGGVQGRVQGGIGKASGTWIGGVRGAKTWSNSAKLGSTGKSTVDRSHGDSLSRDGGLSSRDLRQFTGTLRITPHVSSYVRLNVDTRRISFGMPGRSTPTLVSRGATPGAGQPAAHDIPLRLLVPEHLVTTTRPDAVVVDRQNPQPLANPPRITELGGGRSRGLDGAEVVAFLGTEHLQAAAKDQLVTASGDPVFRFADGDNSTRIADVLSPENLKANPRLFSRPIVVDGLHYGRRVADVDGQVAVALTPVNPQVVSAAEYQKIKNTQAGGSSVGKSKGQSYSVDTTFTGVAAMSGPVTSNTHGVQGSPLGVFVAQLSPWSKGWGSSKSGDLKSAEKVTFEQGPVKKTLVRVSVDAEVIAETRVKGNIDKFDLLPGKGVDRSGERFALPGSVLMWVTDAQLTELRHTPAVQAGPAAHAPDRVLAPPASLGQGKVSSLGIGGITTTIDLTDRIPHLHRRLAESLGDTAADRLLPKSSLDTAHDNHREIQRFLSDVHRSANNALNGGKIAPLRLEDRFSGKTYYVTVDAHFDGDPVFNGIDHVDKLSGESSVSLSTAKEKTSTRTIASLMASIRPSGRLAGTAEPVAAGQPQPTTGHGPGAGSIAGGVTAEGSFFGKSTKDTVTVKTDYKHSASVSGPVASFTGKLRFDIRIERHLRVDSEGNEVAKELVASDRSASRDVTIQKLAEESFPAPSQGGRRLGEAGAVTSVAERGNPAMGAWRGNTTLPETGTYATEHFFGDMKDLRKAAEQAVTESGAKVDTATIAALKAGMTPAAFKAGLPAMVDGKFTVPLPGGRDLEVHARLGDQPRLASVSAGVDVSGSVKTSDETKVELKTGNTYSGTGTFPAGGGGASAPSGADSIGEHRHEFGSMTGSTQNDGKLFTKAGQAEFKAGLPAAKSTSPQSSTALKTDDKITQALLHDVEFRFVVRPNAGSTDHTGVTQLGVRDGYVVRSRPDAANPLPVALTDAATRLTADGKTWSDAAKSLSGLREQSPAVPDVEIHDAETAVQDAETAWWAAKRDYDRELDAAREARTTPQERDLRDREQRQREQDQRDRERRVREVVDRRERDAAERERLAHEREERARVQRERDELAREQQAREAWAAEQEQRERREEAERARVEGDRARTRRDALMRAGAAQLGGDSHPAGGDVELADFTGHSRDYTGGVLSPRHLRDIVTLAGHNAGLAPEDSRDARFAAFDRFAQAVGGADDAARMFRQATSADSLDQVITTLQERTVHQGAGEPDRVNAIVAAVADLAQHGLIPWDLADEATAS